MKLADITFFNKNEEDFWPEYGSRVVAILPMHAEKWHLICSQGDWEPILGEVDVFLADGVGLARGYKFLTGKEVKKISGVDLVNDLVAQFPKTPVYFWGTSAKNIQKAKEIFGSRGLNVVGFHDGFTGTDKEVLAEIKKSKAQIVFVGMAPRRAAELVVRIKKELVISAMTVGGTFDVASGEHKRAPRFFQRVGLEWLWRMIIEPKRFKRFPRLLGFEWDIIKEKYAKKV